MSSKVTAKIKWNGQTVTLRLSGTWKDVIMALHDAGQTIKYEAIGRGLVPGLRRPRARQQCHPVKQYLAEAKALRIDPADFDDG